MPINMSGRLGRSAKALAQMTTVLAVCMIVMTWAGIEFYLHNERQSDIRTAERTAENYARLFEEHIARLTAEVDKTLLFVRQAYIADPSGFDLKAWFANQYYLADVTVQIALIGSDGYLLATNLGAATARMDLGDREHFQVHRSATVDRLFVSKPVFGRASGRWTIQLTRPMHDAAGAFKGVVVASVDPYRLSRFYESIDIGQEGAVAVFGLDGIIRAQAGLTADNMGKMIPDPTVLAIVAQRPVGRFVSAESADGPSRITAYRTLRDLPLVVTVGIGAHDAVAASANLTTGWRAAGAAMTFVLLAVIAVGARARMRTDGIMEALRESEAKTAASSHELEVTLNTMSQGLLVVDKDDRVSLVNQRAIQMLNLPPDLMATRPPFRSLLNLMWERGEFGEDGETLDPDMRDFIRDGARIDHLRTFERIRPDGTVLEVRSVPVAGGGFVRTFTDITERKRAEVALAEARDRAEAASKARSAFLAMISHEIRTPLNGVIGMSSILAGTPLTEEQRKHVNTITACGQALLTLIDDVLDFSKLDSGVVEVELADAVLADVVSGATAIVEARAQEKGLRLSVTVDPALPAAIKSDAARLRQVLLNLLGNAVKFTDSGSVEVKVSAAGTPGAPMLRFAVRDTGIGIPEAARERLFMEFSQVDASITRRYGGTGLGLAICKRIVEALKGEIGFTSREGEGSIFWFDVPLVPAASQPAPAAGRAERSEREGEEAMSILLVEDNVINQQVSGLLLTKLGHAVAYAANGAEAVAKCRAQPFDLVLMDMQMPVMDGLEATRVIRADGGRLARQPIVGLTANAFAADRSACLAAGMNGFISKPVTVEKMRQAIAIAHAAEAGEFDDADLPEQRRALEADLGPEVVQALVEGFWRDTARVVEALEGALAGQGARTPRELLHTLQGSASNLGFESIVEACRAMRRVLEEEPQAAGAALAGLRSAITAAHGEELVRSGPGAALPRRLEPSCAP